MNFINEYKQIIEISNAEIQSAKEKAKNAKKKLKSDLVGKQFEMNFGSRLVYGKIESVNIINKNLVVSIPAKKPFPFQKMRVYFDEFDEINFKIV